ncbi:MAG: electron transfer flavoprotein subunit alpha/FixB family protein [Anaerolineales bacterium]|nr:electron transfer flavoprotein subunit alpha/FixB family protein [Anaerolineales bacterium]
MNQNIFVVVEHLQGQVTDISYVMLAAARDLAHGSGGDVVAILLGHNAQELANTLAADLVLYGDDPALAEFTANAYQDALAGLISDETPRAILFGSTTIGTDVAGVLAARLGLPMVSSCIKISEDGKIVSQICGGKIMAETDLGDTTTVITMIPGGYKPEQGQSDGPPKVTPIEVSLGELKVTLKAYVEPEVTDVDITKVDVLISVGRGIQTEDNIELAEELAELLGGAVCASRPIVDQGWLPISRMVGKSGNHVKPKVYLALGISGAPEHVEGMADAETIIAINIDSNAPIFDVAKYGVEVDLFDLIDCLIEAVEEVA